MNETFEAALNFVFQYEGGYSDHRSDPGGATNYGITHAVLSCWRGHSVSKTDVRNITRQEAAEIYKANYWRLCHCHALPAGLDLAVFDCAVNQGVSRAVRLLQQSVKVHVDGLIGPVTLAAVNRRSAEDVVTEFMARRMRAYGSLTRLFRTFGLGWSRRLIACHVEALRLITTS